LNSPLPTTVYYYINNQQRNVEDFQVKGIDAALNYDFDTSFGHFTIGDNVTYLLQYGIAYGFPTPSQYFNVLNSSGFTSQFDQIQLQSRTHVGWTLGNLALDVFMNYIGPYRNLSSTAANPASVPILTGGSIITGGDHVNSSETFDMHLAYNIPDGFLGGDQVFVNGQNIFDTKPPFYSSAMGYDDYAGSLIGRVMSLGLRARF
jgi:iron complex outermembrane recepter protein